jgi:hypothetical protein
MSNNNVYLDLLKPFLDFPVKKIVDDTASAESLAKVQWWLEACQSSHALCVPRNKGPIVLPKRVRIIEERKVPNLDSFLSKHSLTYMLPRH